MSKRSTIRYPDDVIEYIEIMQKKEPKLSINEALFVLARRGMANENIASIDELQEKLSSLDNQILSMVKLLKLDTKTDVFITKIYAILRRYIYEKDKDILPLCDETANILYEKTQGK